MKVLNKKNIDFFLNYQKIKIIFFTLLIFILFNCILCSSANKYCKIFLPNGVSLTAELAVTDEEKELGLMFRDSINWDQAMLFIFEEETIPAFWMKDVRFSIDIIWLNKEKRIVYINKDVSPCKEEPCPTYSPDSFASYVLELKAGSSDKYNLKLYDKIQFILPKRSEK